jgi:hypothetical protein
LFKLGPTIPGNIIPIFASKTGHPDPSDFVELGAITCQPAAGEANLTAAGVGREALKLANCASFYQATGQI